MDAEGTGTSEEQALADARRRAVQQAIFYIDLPDGGGFANIYVLTRNYYFNAYRVAPEAFKRILPNAETWI